MGLWLVALLGVPMALGFLELVSLHALLVDPMGVSWCIEGQAEKLS